MGTCGYHLGLVAQLVLHHTLRSPPPQSPHAPRKQVVLRCQLHRTAVRECGLGAVGPHPQALPRAHRGHTLRGVAEHSAVLQTSGAGASGEGNQNDATVVELAGVVPDAWGHLFIDIAIETGSYAYLSALELVVE